MIEAARLLTPDDLLDSGRDVLARLDTDGPEPVEHDAHTKETLSLRRADSGVKFTGYLAGENDTEINGAARARTPSTPFAQVLTQYMADGAFETN